MIADLLASILLFALVSFGLGWPLAARLTSAGPERIMVTAAVSLLGAYLVAWAVYVASLPLEVLWILPAGALAGLGAGWRSLRETWRDPEVRELCAAQGIVTAWCVGWLALVVTYSGGGWAGDWFGHWQRVVFFLERGPPEILFNGFDPLTSRPPLVNVIVGALLWLTRIDFAHYQLAMTFLSSLVFLSAALLARRWGGRAAIPVLAVLVMLNPMFLQNATYPWTKLFAGFYVLAAVHFLLRAFERDGSAAGPLLAASLGAALLAHYSAGPYAVVLGMIWIIVCWRRRHMFPWGKETSRLVVIGAVVLATWFGWALAVYGLKSALLTSTTVTDKAPTIGAQLAIFALNLRDTLVPHFLRDLDYGWLTQASRWGWWRDWFFQLYQLNFFFLFGSVGWLALAVALFHDAKQAPRQSAAAWTFAVVSTVLLGVGVHSGRDPWGLAHICLQPLALIGLAYLAARWERLGTAWKRVLVAGVAFDLAAGVMLHFGAQSFLLDLWLAPDRPAAETLRSYSSQAGINLYAKSHFKFTFLGDRFSTLEAVMLVLLGTIFALAIFRAARRATV